MNSLKEQLTPLYHSYLIGSDLSSGERSLVDFLEKDLKIDLKGNPDVFHQSYTTFTIDDARKVKEEAQRKKVGPPAPGSAGLSPKKIFILLMGAMTREAGNALLKTLEEPFDDTHFFIITPSIANILPTILSRCRLIRLSSSTKSELAITPQQFIQSSKAERIQTTKDIMSDLEKEKITKAEIVSFIEQLLRELHKKETGENIIVLGQLSSISSYSRDQSASLKMILEYLAISLT